MAFAAALLLITGVTSTSLAPASAAPVQGLTWSAGGALPSNSWQAIAYGNGLFLAVASDGAVVTSADSGATWQSAGSVPPANFSALAYGNPKGIPTWVMVTKNTKSIRTSVDNGVTWTSFSNDVENLKVAYSDGHFVVAAYFDNHIWVSDDGLAWILGGTYSQRSVNHWGPFLAGNHTLVDPSTYTRDVCAWDTSAWPATGVDTVQCYQDVLVAAIDGCQFYDRGAYGNGIYAGAIDACSGRPYIQASSDKGATWSAATNMWTEIKSLAFGDGIFVALLNGGGSAFSTDALAWIASTASGVGAPPTIAFGNHHFVVINGASSAIGIASVQTTAADTPTNVLAAAGNRSAAVSWTAPAADGGDIIDGYTVTGSPSGHCVSTGATSCTVAGLTAGASYTFTVTAHNANGDSVPSVSTSPVIPVTNPGVLAGVAADAGNGTASVTWTIDDTGGSAVTSIEFAVDDTSTDDSATNITGPHTLTILANS